MKNFAFAFFLFFLPLAANPPSEYKAKNFSHLIGIDGFTKNLLEMHFKLYEGYVKNTNILLTKLRALSAAGQDKTPEFAALKRIFGWEFDGMRLHELYFENLGGKEPLAKSPLLNQITEDFGSFDKWKQEFTDTGLMRGIGWIILYFDKAEGKLMNAWISEHNVGELVGATPLLVMDVWEHAYMTEYGLDRLGYIENFLKNVDWAVVAERYRSK